MLLWSSIISHHLHIQSFGIGIWLFVHVHSQIFIYWTFVSKYVEIDPHFSLFFHITLCSANFKYISGAIWIHKYWIHNISEHRFHLLFKTRKYIKNYWNSKWVSRAYVCFVVWNHKVIYFEYFWKIVLLWWWQWWDSPIVFHFWQC